MTRDRIITYIRFWSLIRLVDYLMIPSISKLRAWNLRKKYHIKEIQVGIVFACVLFCFLLIRFDVA